MHDLPFDKPGRFWKGNLHTHSTKSDGSLSPEAVCQYYEALGYDFLSITDHFIDRYGFPITDTTVHHTEDFTTILGAELHTGETEFGGTWHILANGLPTNFEQTKPDETGPELAQRALDAGAFVSVAHPSWYTLSPNDIIRLKDAHAIEVYNGTSHDHNDRVWSMDIAQLMLSMGYRFTLCATDDAHFPSRKSDVGLGWVHVKAEANTPTTLLEALKAGHYYSSTGPHIFNIEVTSNSVKVECSPATRIFLVGQGAAAVSSYGPSLRSASLNLSQFRDHKWVMVIVRDQAGNRAWSNPIWLDVV